MLRSPLLCSRILTPASLPRVRQQKEGRDFMAAVELQRGKSCAAGGVKLFLEEVLNASSPQNWSRKDALVFLKHYDPEQTQIRYIGTLFVKASSRPSDILPKLRSLAGFCADEEMELYEELKFEPSVICEAIDANITFSGSQTVDGDIICYQKSAKSSSHHAYHSVQILFQRIHDLKAVVLVLYFSISEDLNSSSLLLVAGLYFLSSSTVEELIDQEGGGRNRELIEENFIAPDVEAIYRIPIGNSTDDTWAWNYEKLGFFTVRSAYKTLSARSRQNEKFKLLGHLIARAVLDGRILDIPLSKTFYKIMLDQHACFC